MNPNPNSRRSQRARRPLDQGGNAQHSKVFVILLMWEGDRDGSGAELLQLQTVFHQEYNYTTIPLLIPNSNSEQVIRRELERFDRNLASTDTLLIVHYSGHGRMNPDGSFQIYSHGGDSNVHRHPFEAQAVPRSLNWNNAIQMFLQELQCDVLITIDSCHSGTAIANAPNSVTSHTKEIITSSGYEQSTPGPGHGSYTFCRALIEELRERATRLEPFTVASLHRGVTQRIIGKLRRRGWILTDEDELPPTPIHFMLGENQSHSSIVLYPAHNITGASGYRDPMESFTPSQGGFAGPVQTGVTRPGGNDEDDDDSESSEPELQLPFRNRDTFYWGRTEAPENTRKARTKQRGNHSE